MAIRHSSLKQPIGILGLLVAARRGLHSKDEGLSLLECLMAVAVIMLTAAMITPPLFIATATRVQNRRAEQALQLAQGEVDRLRVLMSQSQNTPARLPVSVGIAANPPAPGGLTSQLKSVNSSCNTYNDEQIAATAGLKVDVDGDCEMDFFMQTFRTNGVVPPSENPVDNPGARSRPTDFVIGVRVYSFLAQSNLGSLDTQQASLQLTNGQGSQRRRPLAVLYSSLNWSDQSFNLCQIQQNQGRATCR
jgi:type II secretory pathway pseudopilin PulG